MNLGFSEVAFILVAALLLVGPRKLPEIGRQVGRAMAEFKRATSHLQAQIEEVSRSVEMAKPVPRPRRPSFLEVVTSTPQPVATAAHEENHV